MNQNEHFFNFTCDACLFTTKETELITLCPKCKEGHLGSRFMLMESEYDLLFKAFYKNINRGKLNKGNVEENLTINLLPPFDLENGSEEFHIESNGANLVHIRHRVFRKPVKNIIKFNDIKEIELEHEGGMGGAVLSYCQVCLTIITKNGGWYQFITNNDTFAGDYALLGEDDYTLVFMVEWLSKKSGISISGDKIYKKYFIND